MARIFVPIESKVKLKGAIQNQQICQAFRAGLTHDLSTVIVSESNRKHRGVHWPERETRLASGDVF
jgi:hypothetical protein